MAHATFPAVDWQPATWQNEKVLVSVSLDWKAVVSLARGRLLYFGPAGREFNLLLAPPNRDNPNIWGGHRVWLGPQTTWSKIWPPPQAWELSGPETFTIDHGALHLVMADAGEGWPRLTRTYHWEGAKLVCGVELHGGIHPAQVIQIFQVPSAMVVSVQAVSAKGFPAGYVRLPSASSRFSADFTPPPQVTAVASQLTLRHSSAIEKLGFRPQALIGRAGAYDLTVSRGTQTGQEQAEPDAGFFTQVYLGGHEPLIELEQLSPLFSPAAPASFTVVLEGSVH
jgi:hypothetical protein